MCKFCESNGNAYLINHETFTTKPVGLQVSLSFGKLGARCYGDVTLAKGVDIHFCPMCGRNLEHEKERLDEVRRCLGQENQ